MGEVYLAEDVSLERKVALKFLPTSLQSDPVARKRFHREAKSAAALDHPFICKVYEVTEANGQTCIAMEYVPGKTLESRLAEGPLLLTEALEIAIEIAEALEEAHARHIVHRDLKPSNIMLTNQGHAKVMDFGLAKQFSAAPVADDQRTVALDLTDAGTRVGTLAYMSPEQVIGGSIDGRSDIFSFGIVLYQMVSGTHPFHRTTARDTVGSILRDPPAPISAGPATVCPSLKPVLEKLMAKQAADRHESFQEVRKDLQRVTREFTRTLTADAVEDEETVLPEGPGSLLVGRDADIAELSRALDHAIDGQGTLVLIAGEPGIGKTRLAEELLRLARQRECVVLTGRCHDMADAPPFIPFAEMLDQACRTVPSPALRDALGDAAPEVAKLLPELTRRFPDIPAPASLPVEHQRRFLFTSVLEFLVRLSRFLFNSVREFLDRLSRVAPVVLVLDDLQWADESTLLLVQHMAHELRKMPALMLATHRDVEPESSQALTHALETLTRQRLAHRMTIKRLSESGVAAMLANLGGQPAPDGLVRAVYEQTDGNPFFIEEVFHHLAEEGRLLDDQRRWRADLRVEELDVPEGVRLVIGRRLERLSEQAMLLLTASAVIGRTFDLRLLEELPDVDDDDLVNGIEEAERARLIIPIADSREPRWRFGSELVRQTLAGSLSTLRRRRWHLRIVEAMERAYVGGLDPHAADLVHHLSQAGVTRDAKAVRYMTLAGDRARAMYANEDAAVQYQRALEALADEPPDHPDRLALHERLGDLLAPVGRREEADRHYRAWLTAHEMAGNRAGQARAHRKIGALHWHAGDRGRARACWEAALALLEGQTEELELAQVYQELGRLAFRSGDNASATDWAQRAIGQVEHVSPFASAPGTTQEHERQREAVAALSLAYNTLGVALARTGDVEQARAQIERSVSVAEQHGLLDVACRGYANLGVLYGSADPNRAIETCLAGLEVAKKIGDLGVESTIYANLAAAYCALSDSCEEQGTAAAQASIELDRRLGHLDHLAVPLIVLAQIQQCHGASDAAVTCYREALDVAERVGEPQLLFPCYDGLATTYLDMGEMKQAEMYMLKAQELCERAGLDPNALLVLPFLC
jgi:predicted ATPase